MSFIFRYFFLRGFWLILVAGICFSGDHTLDVYGEEDTSKYMGYAYNIETTSDDYCIDTVILRNGTLTPGTGVSFDVHDKGGAFSYYGRLVS